jgi:hypothetical protein
MVLWTLFVAQRAGAAISRAELIEMATKHVDPRVMLALVQRDCVDFDLTPAIAVELSRIVQPDILNAIIDCRQQRLTTPPIQVPLSSSIPVPAPVIRRTWETFYPKAGQTACLELGRTKAEVFATLQAEGFQTSGDHASFWCTAGKASEELCEVHVDDPAWRYVRPAAGDDEHFAFQFTDNHLVATMYLLEFVDRDRATQAYREARVAMTEAFHKPAEALGFWRRQLLKLSMWSIKASAEDAATWQDEHYSAAVLLGGRNVGKSTNPVVLVVMTPKAPD